MTWQEFAGWAFTLGCIVPLAIFGIAILASLIIVFWESFSKY